MICLEKGAYTQRIQTQILDSFNLELVEVLDGFTCHVLLVKKMGKTFFLKISHSSWESIAFVKSEQKILQALNKKSIPITPMESKINSFEDANGGYYHARF